MTYLYGDSTDSGLELNYIELLREFLDFAVQVMLSEHRVATGRVGADDAKRNAAVAGTHPIHKRHHGEGSYDDQ